MIIIQVLLIIFILIALVPALSFKSNYATHAYRKIAIFFLAILMIVTVVFPDITNYVARAVGVGRGADLITYALVVAFISLALYGYISKQKERDTIVRLARKIAIIEANKKYKIDKN